MPSPQEIKKEVIVMVYEFTGETFVELDSDTEKDLRQKESSNYETIDAWGNSGWMAM